MVGSVPISRSAPASIPLRYATPSYVTMACGIANPHLFPSTASTDIALQLNKAHSVPPFDPY